MESSTALIFIPGLGNDEALWRHQIAAVRSLCAPQVIVLDRQETLQEMASVVLSAVDGRFALVGFSMGGRVSLEIMKSAPERVTCLALLSCSAQPGRRTISSPYQGSLEQIIETDFLGTMHEAARANPKLVDTVSAMVRCRRARAATACNHGEHRTHGDTGRNLLSGPRDLWPRRSSDTTDTFRRDRNGYPERYSPRPRALRTLRATRES